MTRLLPALLVLVAIALTHARAGAQVPPDLVRTHLENQVGNIVDRPVSVGGTEELAGCGLDPLLTVPIDLRGGCVALAYDDRIHVSPLVWREFQRGVPWAVAVILHENLHRPGDDSTLDEGIVQALTEDACPAVRYAIFGGRHRKCAYRVYVDQVDAVRAASARATGTEWKSRAARIWRRALWSAPHSDRLPTYQAAWS